VVIECLRERMEGSFLCVFYHACLMVHLLIGTYFSSQLGSNVGSQWRGIFLLFSFMHMASS
jgi:hypothetical protein